MLQFNAYQGEVNAIPGLGTIEKALIPRPRRKIDIRHEKGQEKDLGEKTSNVYPSRAIEALSKEEEDFGGGRHLSAEAQGRAASFKELRHILKIL